jgi:hypothetical protein
MLLSHELGPELVSMEPQSYGPGISTFDAELHSDNNTTTTTTTTTGSRRDFTRRNLGLETALRSLGAAKCSSTSLFLFIPMLFYTPLIFFLHFAFIVCALS